MGKVKELHAVWLAYLESLGWACEEDWERDRERVEQALQFLSELGV